MGNRFHFGAVREKDGWDSRAAAAVGSTLQFVPDSFQKATGFSHPAGWEHLRDKIRLHCALQCGPGENGAAGGGAFLV